MPKIEFISEDRTSRFVDAAVGESLLTIARFNAIPGILGDCGGELTCGTCHGYIAQTFLALLPPPGEDERAMLEGWVENPEPNSRLCCQVKVTEALDGMAVFIPKQL